MLSMVNSEHKASPTADAYRGYAGDTAGAASPGGGDRVNVKDENTPPDAQRDIPVPVLVKHEEYSTTAAFVADQSGEESSTSATSGGARSGTRSGSGSSTAQDAAAKRQREKRSTKSKCPPGLRSGKWTPEEEAFTNMIIYYFKLGRLNVEDGTSLRWYLAKRLNCEAMRVTKKLKGNSSIGKQIFRALEDTEENRRAIEMAADELSILENSFLDSLTATGQPSGPGSSSSTSAAASAAARAKKSSPHKPLGVLRPPNLETKKLVVHKVRSGLAASEDAKLLMHFFVEAQDSTDAPPNMEKKRLFSETETSPSTASSSTESPVASKRRPGNVNALLDAA